MHTHYVFWLAAVSLACLIAERVAPWRKGQRLWRKQFGQDIFWLVFNGHLAAIVFVSIFRAINASLDVGFDSLFRRDPNELQFIAAFNLTAQVAIVLVIADLTEWLVHNALHRVNFLWGFHRVHHSIRIMDWIGNFRFHWAELIVYKTVKYLPVAVLGARWEAMLAVAVISTTIGHLNHSNLNISWGPLRYIINSPRMHIWHHDKKLRGTAGVNFAVVFSLWDWLFGTAYMPRQALQPVEIGFQGMERTPSSLWRRFLVPNVDRRPPDAV